MENKFRFQNWREALAWFFGQDPRYSFTVATKHSTLFKVSCLYNPGTSLNFIFADQFDKSDMVLLSLEITHPDTPGLNNYWKTEFRNFEENAYELFPRRPGKDGLSFDEKNVASLFEDLKTGYRGTERHFCRGDSLLALHLRIEEGCLGGIKSLEERQFLWRPNGFVNRIKWFFSSNEERSKIFLTHEPSCLVKEVDLATVFQGVRASANEKLFS